MALKRDLSLQPFSREHHHALLLCWKIKTGFSKGVSVERIKAYADWFYRNYLRPHFDLEEQYVFPILGNTDPLVRQALAEHTHLAELFHENKNAEVSLRSIERELSKHIRFEERILFTKVQDIASSEQLNTIRQFHKNENFEENNSDAFWV